MQDSRLFTNMNYHYVTGLPALPASLGEFVFTAFRKLPSFNLVPTSDSNLLTRTSVEALIQAELANALRHVKRVNVACLDEAVKERVLRPRSL